MTLWEVDIYPAAGQPDLAGRRVAADAADLGLGDQLTIRAAYGYLLQGELTREQVELLARELLSDPIVERTTVAPVGDAALAQPPPEAAASACPVHVLPKPGVMDPVAAAPSKRSRTFDLRADEVRTFRKYWIDGLDGEQVRAAVRQSAGQRRDRTGRRRAAAVRATGRRSPVPVPAGHGAASAIWTTTRWCGSAARGSSI